MSGHSIFAPSSMSVLVKCHGSLMMSSGIEEEESNASREGTAAHWVAAKLLSSDVVTVGEVAENGVIVDEQMIDGAQVYFDHIDKIIGESWNAPVVVEQPVAITRINPDCWGTPDAWWFDRHNGVLHVWDYKYGHERVVANGNWQGAAYETGVLDALDLKEEAKDLLTIKFHIVQPRCFDGQGPIHTWTTNRADLRAYVNVMEYACLRALSSDVTVTSGSHCTNCLARHKCDAASAAAAAALDYSMSAVPRELTPVGLMYEEMMLAEAATRIKTRQEALLAEIEARLRNGEQIPGRMLKPKCGHRKWLVDDEMVYSVGDMIGVDFRDTKPVTPSKADDIVKKASVDNSVIADYYGKKQTGMEVVVDDGSIARNIFGKGEI